MYEPSFSSQLSFFPSISPSSPSSSPFKLITIIISRPSLLGAFIMRSAGCTINDLWDADFDKQVERTKERPLANGSISSFNALLFLGLQLSGGLVVLLTLNSPTILLGLASMPLVVAYPLMKRFTYFPQFVLGLAFNWGALVGWSAVTATDFPLSALLTASPSLAFSSLSSQAMSLLSSPALPLYLSGVCWTLIYDTIYGYQDRSDDLRIGLRSTSIYLGDKPQIPLTLLSLGMMAGLSTTGAMAELSLPFYAGLAAVETHLLWQIWTVNLRSRENLWMRFQSNTQVGGLIAAAIVAGHF